MRAGMFVGQHRVAYGSEQIVFDLRRQPSRVASCIAVHVGFDGRVQVDAPSEAPLEQVLAAVRKRSRWISRHVSAARTRLAHVVPRQYVSGESLHYLGRRYRLKVIELPGSSVEARLRGAFVVLTVPGREPAAVKAALEAWYRQRAREVFAQRLLVVAAPLRWLQELPPVRLQAMTRQWGSCSPGGRITVNPWLVAAPREAIDYVLLHELCHLKHHNHSRAFYATLKRYMPNWEQTKASLDAQAELYLRR
jgi:predicted metal-dependent hydrolase